MSMTSAPSRARKAFFTSILAAAVAGLVAVPVLSASAAPGRAPGGRPAALDTCKSPTNSFVSLEVAPEISGQIPLSAGYNRLWDMAVAWKDVNPAPGQFNWSTLDSRVAQAQASGAIPMLVLGLTPQWAAADPTAGDPRWGAGTASPPANMNNFRDYVDAVVSRYGGRIGAYEVWNEANLQTFFTGTPAQMAQMTQIAYNTIKAKNPGAVVTAASVTTRLRSPMAKFVTPYAQALKDLGFPIDAWAIHTYPAGNAGPAERKSDIKNWQQVVATAVGAGSPGLDKQVWDTEVNYGLAGPGSTPPTDYSDAQGADLIRQTFADSLELGIDATFWYLLTASPFDLLGVQLWSGTPQSLQAFKDARAMYNNGAALCGTAGGGTSGGGTSGGGGSTTAKSLTLTACTRDATGKKITVRGTSTGLENAALDLFLRIGKGKFKDLGDGVVGSDGSVSITRATTNAKPVRAFVRSGSIQSNKIGCQR